MFQVQTFNPHRLLEHCVDSYQMVSVDHPEDDFIENTLLPHVTPSLVFGLDEEHTVYDCFHAEFCPFHFISGPNDSVCHIRFFPGMKKLMIHFKAGGFFKIFRIPVHDFIHGSRDARDFLGPQITEIGEHLRSLSLARQIDLINQWLIARLEQQKKPDRNIDEAIGLIEKFHGNISIRQLEKETFTTKRTLERHFMEQVGLHPKTFSRLIRFKGVIRLLESNLQIKWRQLADAFGYYDQSHFIHDFKTLTGTLPQHYSSLKTEFDKMLQT